MKKFAHLIFALNGSNNPAVRLQELLNYFRQAEPNDLIWALFLLLGKRPKKLFDLEQLKNWLLELTQTPGWLFDAAFAHTRDLAITITRFLPSPAAPVEKSLSDWLMFLHHLRHLSGESQKTKIQTTWRELDLGERFLINKLLTGGFRIKLPGQFLLSALAEVCGTSKFLLAWRLAQDWHPSRLTFAELTAPDAPLEAQLTPWPFPETQEISSAGNNLDFAGWIAVRDYPGINLQLIFRDGKLFLWSTDHEFLNPRFPEFENLAHHFPGNIRILGKITGVADRHFYGIEHLGLLNQEIQPMILAYDLLEVGECDCRQQDYFQRQQQLINFIQRVNQPHRLQLPQKIVISAWENLRQNILAGRKQGFAGARLFRRDAGVENSQQINAPEYQITAVLLYVQRIPGNGLRKGLEITFAIQGETELIPCARLATHLETAEALEILDFVKKNTVEKFGPVRSVKPELIFEIAFDAMLPSARHKAGLKLIAPRIIRRQREKTIAEIDTLHRLREILHE